MHRATTPVTLADNPLIRRLHALVAELDLDPNDFVIFGSGPLLAHGLREHISDLDIVARGETAERAFACGAKVLGEINGAELAVFDDGRIQFSRGWISDAWSADELIDKAKFIGGLRYARLDDVLRFKQALGRLKDLKDIEAIQRFLHPRPSR
jgi:hypothetical protein